MSINIHIIVIKGHIVMTEEVLQELINMMVTLGTVSRSKGLLSLMDVKTNSPFLKRVRNLLADAADEETLRSAMRTEIDSMQMRHFIVQDVFKKMAMYAPSFGMLGTLIGLIQMLSLLANPETLGPAMAVALLTTFYGAVMANMIFSPLASKLERNSSEDALINQIHVMATASMGRHENPRRLEMLLNTLLPPDQRIEYFG